MPLSWNEILDRAFDYFPGLKERDLPRYVLVSDFARFRWSQCAYTCKNAINDHLNVPP